MTSQEHLQAARQVAQTINHVKPANRVQRVKTWAAHIRALLGYQPKTTLGKR